MSHNDSNRVRKTQDPSGHITMDVATSAFYNSIQKKADMIILKRQQGIISDKVIDRNPLRAEKTPRKDWKLNYSFAIPEKPLNMVDIRANMWNDKTEDIGLMAKLASQKPYLQKMNDKQNRREQLVKTFQGQQQQQQQQQVHESAAIISSRTGNNSSSNNNSNDVDDCMNTSRSNISNITMNTSRSAQLSSRTNNNNYNSSSSSSSTVNLLDQYNKDDLNNIKISSIRVLNKPYPEILDKIRNQRAINYIETLTNPLAIPTASTSTSKPFRPAGPIIRTNAAADATAGTTVDDGNKMKMLLKLQKQLIQTEKEIKKLTR